MKKFGDICHHVSPFHTILGIGNLPDVDKRRCVRFNYGGCQGNANNFRSYWACMRRCEM